MVLHIPVHYIDEENEVNVEIEQCVVCEKFVMIDEMQLVHSNFILSLVCDYCIHTHSLQEFVLA